MVGVVVCEDDALHHVGPHAVAFQHGEHLVGVHAGIDEHAFVFITQERAVATTAAPKTCEMPLLPLLVAPRCGCLGLCGLLCVWSAGKSCFVVKNRIVKVKSYRLLSDGTAAMVALAVLIIIFCHFHL